MSKRIIATIKEISFAYNEIQVVLTNMPYSYFIQPENVNFFPVDKYGNSKKGILTIGTEIEFERDINPKTRNLKKVQILIK